MKNRHPLFSSSVVSLSHRLLETQMFQTFREWGYDLLLLKQEERDDHHSDRRAVTDGHQQKKQQHQ
jgi:hypothetical protein